MFTQIDDCNHLSGYLVTKWLLFSFPNWQNKAKRTGSRVRIFSVTTVTTLSNIQYARMACFTRSKKHIEDSIYVRQSGYFGYFPLKIHSFLNLAILRRLFCNHLSQRRLPKWLQKRLTGGKPLILGGM